MRKAELLNAGLFILCLFLLSGFVGCGSTSSVVYVCPDGNQQSTPCPTPNPTINTISQPTATQPSGSTPVSIATSTTPIAVGCFASKNY